MTSTTADQLDIPVRYDDKHRRYHAQSRRRKCLSKGFIRLHANRQGHRAVVVVVVVAGEPAGRRPISVIPLHHGRSA